MKKGAERGCCDGWALGESGGDEIRSVIFHLFKGLL